MIAQAVGQDPFARSLGIEVLEVGAGYSKVAVTVDERMLNSHRTAHGGLIFSLADVAFALACNSHGQLAVALNVSIHYVAPVAPGTRLIAEATRGQPGPPHRPLSPGRHGRGRHAGCHLPGDGLSQERAGRSIVAKHAVES